MGFTKTTLVQAVGFSQAVTFAGDWLLHNGYRREDFEAIEVTRGMQVADGSPAGCEVTA